MECYRWNFEANESALLVCRNDHDKGDTCDMRPMHPADVLSLVNDLRARVLNAEAKEAAAVAAERERCAKLCEEVEEQARMAELHMMAKMLREHGFDI